MKRREDSRKPKEVEREYQNAEWFRKNQRGKSGVRTEPNSMPAHRTRNSDRRKVSDRTMVQEIVKLKQAWRRISIDVADGDGGFRVTEDAQ